MRKRLVALCLAVLMLIGLLPVATAEGLQAETRSYATYFGSLDATLTDPFPLVFLNGVDDLPYLRIEDMGELLWLMNREWNDDPGYELTIHYNGPEVTLERDNGYTAVFDFEKDSIVFTDYNAFLHKSSDTTLLDLLSDSGFDANGEAQLFMRDKEASFNRYGDEKRFDLSAYGIDMVLDGEEYYIPLQTVNDLFLYPAMRSGLLFNGEALFLAGDQQLFDMNEGVYTKLAEMYYSAPTGNRSDALADYGYRELCLVLDTLYGLKEPHDIRRFAQTFWEIGLDEALSGPSAEDADNALKNFIDYYLDDLHSTFNEFSYLAGLLPIHSSTGISNRRLEDHLERFTAARGDNWQAYEEVGNTAYVTFDGFDSLYRGEAFYAGLEDGEIPTDDTIGLIIYAHQQITRPGSPIENVVLDLSCNLGGAVDAAIFVLGWLLGDAPFSVKDMSTGAMSTSIYRADVNLDRKFDEADTISDKNLYCLISPVSFSCGNLVPAALKASQKVTLLGQTSGGGSCIVQPLSTAWGTVFQISSSLRMSFLKNGSFYDIDQGVSPDFYISRLSNFYDRQALTDYINSLY